MKFAIILGLVSALMAAGKIDHTIFQNIHSHGNLDVLVSFKNSRLAQVRTLFIATHKLSDRTTRLNSFYRTLKHHADQTQSKLLSSLGKLGSFKSIKTRQLWITNQLIIKNASQETIQMLLGSDEVSKVEADRIIPLLDPVDNKLYEKTCNTTTNDGIPWGISRIEAPKAWAEGFRGQGVVVSNVDTGVQYTHEALKGNHRAEYGWFDPYNGTTIPSDQHGHGTHNMGTLVGKSKVIGVAPEARWIACKGCSTDGCSGLSLLECGQWTACPTDPDGQNPNCAMAPLVTSSSWGSYYADGSCDEILAAYDAAGIHAVFAIGNGGPRCSSTTYPGYTIFAALICFSFIWS